jgi:hypothetical protein
MVTNKAAGMDATLLRFLDVEADSMERVVKESHSDDHVLEWLDQNARPWTRKEAVQLNHAILAAGQRTREGRDSFERRRRERHPARPEIQYFVDLIEADAGRPIRSRPLDESCYDP